MCIKVHITGDYHLITRGSVTILLNKIIDLSTIIPNYRCFFKFYFFYNMHGVILHYIERSVALIPHFIDEYC